MVAAVHRDSLSGTRFTDGLKPRPEPIGTRCPPQTRSSGRTKGAPCRRPSPLTRTSSGCLVLRRFKDECRAENSDIAAHARPRACSLYAKGPAVAAETGRPGAPPSRSHPFLTPYRSIRRWRAAPGAYLGAIVDD
jgi:hypothetical protein